MFDTLKIDFLGFVVNQTEIVMESSRVDSVTTWPVPRTFREIQVFFGFVNFYQHFINNFSCVVFHLLDMLKGGMKNKINNKNFAMTTEAFEIFNELKKHFTTVSMLVHYKPKRQITFKTDVSTFAISGIIF